MTTNGVLLAQYAQRLAKAGLNRINISLDTLRNGRFKEITRMGDLSDTLKGIEAAKEAGLDPVKINMVPMRGINDDEIRDFALKTLESGWHVRFIELMPLNRNAKFVPSHVLHKEIESLGMLEPYLASLVRKCPLLPVTGFPGQHWLYQPGFRAFLRDLQPFAPFIDRVSLPLLVF